MVKRKAILIALVAVIVISLGYVAWTFDLGALQKPSKAETFLATKAKHWLVARAVSREKLIEPTAVSLSVSRGRSLFWACYPICLEQLDATQAEGKAQGTLPSAGPV
jgi:hypothetical protein